VRGPVDVTLFVPPDRHAGTALHVQLEASIRDAVREGRLPPGTPLPSSRTFAEELGISRGVVVEAYAQLAAEGHVTARGGSSTRVAEVPPAARAAGAADVRVPRYDFHPYVPDLAAFPADVWLRSTTRAVRHAPFGALGYSPTPGVPQLRTVLATYLGRARGVAASEDRVLVCNGHTQGFALVCRVLRARGTRRIALEDPGFFLHRDIAGRAGLEPVPVPVDEDGLDVERLAASGAEATLVTAAHQSPTGAVLSPRRRQALIAWARSTDALVVEDDYDAEFRFDRDPVGALQAAAPDHVIYAGSASKILAPALRLGWLVLPPSVRDDVVAEKELDDLATPALEQLTLAEFISRGALDRHLRRMRPHYRSRRRALVRALGRHLPEARVVGVPAGLHLLALLPPDVSEDAVLAAAGERRVAVRGLGPTRFDPAAAPPGLMLGYASQPEEMLAQGVSELAGAVAAVRRGEESAARAR
jgi:GntR family transcriptional regulator/MocR family aminotransferase